MNRFRQTFLRDKLNGRTYLAAFGKHPAWDDHIGLIGAQTESLALVEDLLYRQGIASQVAAGRWRDRSGNPKTPPFNHRFVWSRSGQPQSVVGAFWPSTDGKGRSQFPFVCCVQGEVPGMAAAQVYVDYLDKIGQAARDAPSQPEVEKILEHGGYDLNRWKPVAPTVARLALRPEQGNAVRDALGTLARQKVRPSPMLQIAAGERQDSSLRLPPVSDRASTNLWFYAAFLDLFSLTPQVYLLITGAGAAAPVDCILGQPAPGAFFCLGAHPDEPSTPAASDPATLPKRHRQNIDRFLAGCAAGTLASPVRRSFWRWFA